MGSFLVAGMALFFSLAAQSQVPLPQDTLFTAHRTNYKAHKTLVYQWKRTKAVCDLVAPYVEAFYVVEKNGGYVEEAMSADSQKYFAPTVVSGSVQKGSFSFTFPALEQFSGLDPAERRIVVKTGANGTSCTGQAFLTFKSTTYRIRHINIVLDKFLGIPTGVEEVMAELQEPGTGVIQSVCLMGSCLSPSLFGF